VIFVPKDEMFNLESLAGGALSEQIQDNLATVIENIADPNTNWKNKRKLSIVISFTPDEKREMAAVTMEVKSTLAPAKPATTKIIIDRDREGNAVCAEYRSKGVPGQMIMTSDETGAVKIEDTLPSGLKLAK